MTRLLPWFLAASLAGCGGGASRAAAALLRRIPLPVRTRWRLRIDVPDRSCVGEAGGTVCFQEGATPEEARAVLHALAAQGRLAGRRMRGIVRHVGEGGEATPQILVALPEGAWSDAGTAEALTLAAKALHSDPRFAEADVLLTGEDWWPRRVVHGACPAAEGACCALEIPDGARTVARVERALPPALGGTPAGGLYTLSSFSYVGDGPDGRKARGALSIAGGELSSAMTFDVERVRYLHCPAQCERYAFHVEGRELVGRQLCPPCQGADCGVRWGFTATPDRLSLIHEGQGMEPSTALVFTRPGGDRGAIAGGERAPEAAAVRDVVERSF